MLKFFAGKIRSLFKSVVDQDFQEQAEMLFYESDFGSEITEQLMKVLLRAKSKELPVLQLRQYLQSILETVQPSRATFFDRSPKIFLLVGSNGSGKTTTVAKLVRFFQNQGKRVLVVATDSFRAAGMEQLKIWAERLSCGFVAGQEKGDPAAIAFDGIQSGLSKGYDVILIDTSGRQHTNHPLMQELSKIHRVCGKACPEAPHEVMMVVEATLGGNVIDQIRAFDKAVPLDSIILTKTDGSAKGGTLFRIYHTLKIPASFIGTGEGEEDISPFSPEDFLQRFFV